MELSVTSRLVGGYDVGARKLPNRAGTVERLTLVKRVDLRRLFSAPRSLSHKPPFQAEVRGLNW